MQYDEPVKFFEWTTGFKPYKYQTKFLNCKDSRISVRSGRQVGKTTMCAVKALHHAFWNKDRQILIIAPVIKQSKLLFQIIKDCLEKRPEIKETLIKDTASELFFDCGSKIYCLSGAVLSKDRIRGFSPNLLIIDEAAFVPDETFLSAEPSVIRTKGTIILISTPYGKRGFFYDSFSPNSGYTTSHIKSEDCPGISKRQLNKLRKQKTENEYLQEYEGEFTEEGDAYFTRELILSCVSDIKEIDTPEEGYEYFLGVDCARKGEDETVYIIRDNTGEVKKILSDKKQDTTVVLGKIKYLDEIFHFQMINIDDAGTGGAVCDILFKESYPIVGHVFSLIGKERVYRNLKVLMEHGKIKIPNNAKLIQQMGNLITTFTTQGTRIQPPLGRHDDYPDALVMAFKDMKIKEELKDDFFIY